MAQRKELELVPTVGHFRAVCGILIRWHQGKVQPASHTYIDTGLLIVMEVVMEVTEIPTITFEHNARGSGKRGAAPAMDSPPGRGQFECHSRTEIIFERCSAIVSLGEPRAAISGFILRLPLLKEDL
jgi:hypothetical protein